MVEVLESAASASFCVAIVFVRNSSRKLRSEDIVGASVIVLPESCLPLGMRQESVLLQSIDLSRRQQRWMTHRSAVLCDEALATRLAMRSLTENAKVVRELLQNLSGPPG